MLHNVRYSGRPVMHRLSLVEMAVPYADPRYVPYRTAGTLRGTWYLSRGPPPPDSVASPTACKGHVLHVVPCRTIVHRYGKGNDTSCAVSMVHPLLLACDEASSCGYPAHRPELRARRRACRTMPYREPYVRKCAFDVGDYGLGYCTLPLTLGCDCLGRIHYFDATLSNSKWVYRLCLRALCCNCSPCIRHTHSSHWDGWGVG